jgi:La domain/3'-5' exonuclease
MLRCALDGTRHVLWRQRLSISTIARDRCPTHHRKRVTDSRLSTVVLNSRHLIRPLFSRRGVFVAALETSHDSHHSSGLSAHCLQTRSWSSKSKKGKKDKDAAPKQKKGAPQKKQSRKARKNKEKEANERRQQYLRARGKRNLHPASKWKRILSACDFWFSRGNLLTDEFMRETLKRHHGWIPIKTLLTFPKFHHWTDAQLLVDAFNSTAAHRFVITFDKTLYNMPKKKKKERKQAGVLAAKAVKSKVDVATAATGETTTTPKMLDELVASPLTPADRPAAASSSNIRDMLEKYNTWMPVRALLSVVTAFGIQSSTAASDIKETKEQGMPTEETPVADVIKEFPEEPGKIEPLIREDEEQPNTGDKPTEDDDDDWKDWDIVDDVDKKDPRNDEEDWDLTDYEDELSDDKKDRLEDDHELLDESSLDEDDWSDDDDAETYYDDKEEDFRSETDADDLKVPDTQPTEPQNLAYAFVRHRRVNVEYIELLEQEIRQAQQEYEVALEKYEKYYAENPDAVFNDVDEFLLNGKEDGKPQDKKKKARHKEYTSKREVVILRGKKGLQKFCNDLIASARATAAEHGNDPKACAIGFDVEYCTLELDIRNTLPAMIQLSAHSKTGPVGLLWLDKFPDHGRDVLSNDAYAPLTALLADPTILKVGVGASKDVQHLARWWGIDDMKYIDHFFSGIVDIEEEVDENVSGKSLQEMSDLVLHRRLPKMKGKKLPNEQLRKHRRRTPTAHWRTDDMTDRMKSYAVNDAACAIDIWMKINGFGPREEKGGDRKKTNKKKASKKKADKKEADKNRADKKDSDEKEADEK